MKGGPAFPGYLKADAQFLSTGLVPKIIGGPMLITILVIVLLVSLIGSVPAWPHSRSWGYYPSGGLGLVLLILVILLLMGRI
jgi:hypothetical protein